MTSGIGKKVAIMGPRLGTKLRTNVMMPKTYAICTPRTHSIVVTTVATNIPTFGHEGIKKKRKSFFRRMERRWEAKYFPVWSRAEREEGHDSESTHLSSAATDTIFGRERKKSGGPFLLIKRGAASADEAVACSGCRQRGACRVEHVCVLPLI